ncbi:hypothetical protein ACO1KB_05680 [Leptospira interrogans serovar Szwajizak]
MSYPKTQCLASMSARTPHPKIGKLSTTLFMNRVGNSAQRSL